jgi:hypothetical protein
MPNSDLHWLTQKEIDVTGTLRAMAASGDLDAPTQADDP